MNREIKFRGRTANGKWLYGDLVRNQDGRVAIVPPLKGSYNDFHDWEVDQSTVGQYVGLCDRNGVDVYEGDIIRNTLEDTATQVVFIDGYYGLSSEYGISIEPICEVANRIVDCGRLF